MWHFRIGCERIRIVESASESAFRIEMRMLTEIQTLPPKWAQQLQVGDKEIEADCGRCSFDQEAGDDYDWYDDELANEDPFKAQSR